MTPFLTPDAVRQLTGRTYAKAQKAVLRARAIPFIEDGDGRPVVLIADVERVTGSKPESHTAPNRDRLEALQRRGTGR